MVAHEQGSKRHAHFPIIRGFAGPDSDLVMWSCEVGIQRCNTNEERASARAPPSLSVLCVREVVRALQRGKTSPPNAFGSKRRSSWAALVETRGEVATPHTAFCDARRPVSTLRET